MAIPARDMIQMSRNITTEISSTSTTWQNSRLQDFQDFLDFEVLYMKCGVYARYRYGCMVYVVTSWWNDIRHNRNKIRHEIHVVKP